jgi:hypothetical protein
MKRGIGFLAATVICISTGSAFAAPLETALPCEAAACSAPPEGAEAAPFGSEDGMPDDFGPALIPAPQRDLDPQSAIFTVEEATAPFLGPATGAGSQVRIAVEAAGYSDVFTVYFPRGSAYLTLPAGDMVAMAAEALRGHEDAEVWVSAQTALTDELAASRMTAVETILLQNEVPLSWIHVDDGSVDAILHRPASLADDVAL